ncbi:magnesium/cobalt transporter CorA [Gemmatimonas sp.]|jgi:magnesium transporter|uniref:magnesium/cobalt transporter CorA n=1 Tax=Gemmatimonas sp. TaxID=1962908 RepID=UPI0027BACBFD|nr:magnesium/cobalt transporter CorA [Gemmatimonas sp.]
MSRIVPSSDPGRPDPAPRTIYRSPQGTDVLDCHPRDVPQLLAQGGPLWVDIDSTVRSQHALLEKVFGFHPLAIEDTLNPASRVKLEEYPGYLYIIIRAVQFAADTDDPYDLETKDLHCFLGPDYLVTVHAGPVPSVDLIHDTLRRSPDLLSRGVERTLHAILDSTIDAYFPLLDQVDDFIDGLEERVFVNFDELALRDVFKVKRLVLSLRRYLQPTREVLNVLTNRPSTLITPDVQIYFRDVYDHVLRINDELDTYRDLLSSTMDSYLTQVSNRLGVTTKGLSVVATMSLPFVVVSGMWGMNFSRIPLSNWPHGFWVLLLAQLALGGLLIVVLRRQKWL